MSNINVHKKFMLLAQKISLSNVGYTYPNPSVGCVIVNFKNNYNGKIISYGKTGKNGRPHAEENALLKAGNKSSGSTMYLTLEPCNHNSKNDSCTNQIIKSGIKKVFIAKVDPDPRTNRKGIIKLKQRKIFVDVGLTKELTESQNKFFFKSIKFKRPYTKVKMAISNDEKIAWSDYSSKWISNNKSRKFAHKIRLKSQAIFTTSKTVIKDNPRFTVRKNNKIIKFMPVVIIDKNLKIPMNCNLLKNLNNRRIIIFTSINNKKFIKLKSMGCEVYLIKKNKKNNKFNLNLIMKKIFKLKINDILIESGGILFTELLSKKLVDEIHIFKAPFDIGNSGKSMIIDKKIKDLSLKKITNKKFGKDVYHHFLINN